MFEYDKRSKNAVDVLDKYDFTDILEKQNGINIYDLIYELETYNCEVKNALDELSSLEVVEYLQERYGMHCEENIEYLMHWNSRAKRRV